MSDSSLYRLSGSALIIGAALSLVAGVISSLFFQGNDPRPYVHNALFVPTNLLSVVGGLVLLLGLPGSYAIQARRAGVLGLVGTALIFIAAALYSTFLPLSGAILLTYVVDKAPDLFKDQSAGPVGFLIFFIVATLTLTVGLILAAIPMVRRQAWSRELGILFLVSAALNVVGFVASIPSNGTGPVAIIVGVLSQVTLFVGFAWWGWYAWSLQGAGPAATAVAAERSMPTVT
jgi:hypothetical protein